ncbi:uncharacterized protein ATC70_008120 [Mucor velutinosus]|uniref:Uncharacterized protein n=1 Tax=Mucor velutinosus TaxID=708070 RepID=A0AAN7D8S3_9FUNG|nr:hypothetical protein ATC70_008120 [Mucor velutinosus]
MSPIQYNVKMDLSWCIMCDKRIMDDSDSLLKTDALYCSEDCKLKDTSKSTLETSARLVVTKKSLKRATPSTHYPWIPYYNKRRHNYFLAANQIKRCSSPAAQPTVVAGSAASATAVGSGILSLIH